MSWPFAFLVARRVSEGVLLRNTPWLTPRAFIGYESIAMTSTGFPEGSLM